MVYTPDFDPAVATEEQLKEAAKDYVSRCTKPGKLAVYSMYNGMLFASPVFRAEVYRASRERYAG